MDYLYILKPQIFFSKNRTAEIGAYLISISAYFNQIVMFLWSTSNALS